ncbi:AAA family ATPase [Pseudomonas sp. PSKL.D1]|uniref:AAA family ATPase n=1 Tax=Pseudomonas sp. PSKL.D1 TaxID=3029060 RepID=UPI00238175BF|nr:AAA family ATPase [Pseudomonas sp. PSKL.D1]WDY56074.1 AAA family ATPase [Pseudomonas sp. PSKL.D1]
MYYDTRDIRSNTLLKKARKDNAYLIAAETADYWLACLYIGSYLAKTNQTIAQGFEDSAEQVREIHSTLKELLPPVDLDLVSRTHQALRHHLSNASNAELINLINFIADQLISTRIGIDYRHCKIVSGFAGPLFNNTPFDIIDYFPNTADLSVGVRSQGIKYSFLMSGHIDRIHKLLITLKLHCHDITARFTHPLDSLPTPTSNTAYLLNSPSQQVHYNSSPNKTNSLSSVEAYLALSDRTKTRGFYILALTSMSANSKTTQRLWNPYSENIEAIIAFDSYHQNSIKKFLILIINNNAPDNKKRLYINVSNSPALRSLDAIERSMLAASIYLTWKSGRVDIGGMTPRVASAFNSQFKNGYRDINGLCRATHRTTDYNKHLFKPSHYVNFSTQNGMGNDINSATIMEQLRRDAAQCIYVIGNNGAGKSLLLGAVADQLIAAKKSSTGITFSQSHRFPKPKTDEYFTSISSLHNSRPSRQHDIPGLFAKLFCTVDKLKTLLACLTHLDFTEQLYLGPKSYSNAHATIDLDALIALTADVEENINNLTDLHHEAFTLILVKKNDPDRYTFFSELSSGERNIITLLTLSLEYAQRGSTLLLDEPEISLHVSWQQKLPKILGLIAQSQGTSIVCATHSPLLISSAPTLDTHCYSLNIGELNYIPPERRRSVETSLLSIFDTYTPLNKEVYERCARLIAKTIQNKNSESSSGKIELIDAINELTELETTVSETSSVEHDERFHSDLELIRKARTAITAVYDEIRHV